MKRPILTLIILVSALTTLAQATQPCVVKQYNQKQQKTPLAGVQVEVRDAQSATSAANGALSLQFATLKPGDRVTVRRIIKPGYEIFNKAAIDQWTITRGAISEIVLVQSSYFTQLKSKLTQSSTDNYKKKYEQEKAEKERLLEAGKLKEEEYRQQLNDLEDLYDNALKNLDNYIDQFARIDLSEVSAEEQRILDMVQAGQIDEAVKAYEVLDISGKLRQSRENIKAIDEDIEKLKDKKAQDLLAIADLKEKQQREIATLKLAGGKENYDRVVCMLKENALADTTDIDAVWEYAAFAYNQRDFKEAERFFLIALNGSKDNLFRQVAYQNNLGLLHSDVHNYAKAEEYYFKAMENITQLFTQNPDAFRAYLAGTQNNLGTLYHTLHDYTKAEEYYLQALENRTELFRQNPDAYRYELASTQNNLGLLYYALHDYAKAEEYMLQTLENYTQLFQKNPDANHYELATIQNNLGNLYIDLHDYAKAEVYLLQALENWTNLFRKNPDAYRANLADTQNNLGNLYYALHDYAKAEEYCLKALENKTQLFHQNPDAYLTNLAMVQNNLGSLYKDLHDYVKAEEYHLLALENYTQLFSQNPNAYLTDLAMAQYNLGNLYSDLHDNAKAEEYYLKALENITQLFSKNPDAYRAYLAIIQNNLGNLYYDLHDNAKAEEYYFQALEHRTQLFRQNPDAYRADLARNQYNLGLLYDDLHDYAKAEKYYLQTLENYTQLFHKNPDAYRENLAITQYNLGFMYAYLHNYTKAEEYYLKALENWTYLFNQDLDTYRTELAITQHDLGNLYTDLNDYAKAEEYYLQALENRTQLFAQNPDKYCSSISLTQKCLADIYDKNEQFAKAEEYYLLALENYKILFEKRPNDYRADLAWVQYSLMYIYGVDDTRLNQYDDMLNTAWENYEVLYQQDKDYQSTIVDLRNRKGWRLLHADKTDEAIALFESAYQLCPEESFSYLASGYNAKAYEYANNNDFTKALETIDRAIALQPEDANLYDSKGEILLIKGDEQEAVKMWRKVQELDPDFLKKYEGGTSFYKQLKEKGLLDN